ncbi:ubiquinone biosynthesis accessory factor UbiJ [Gilvimarinus xylanilyticus]|uniref:Ubiquinone biosynthesis accessory factor UbiJ n=1 Tax=Gilvimarinus xylanilyticus TaxID=2944139 RepID=A0A9X2KUD6_9GAMM|nr:SCP2 sterol-binding domain-containing protein [Gilvimarinus xylanilyticus]MCP8900806.1 SCP2 sterol-binding domain-containing protein [Gilvimarinus xylanilyticus]
MLDATAIAALAAVLETTAERALTYDPGTAAKLQTLEDKVIAIDCTAPRVTVYILLGNPPRLQQHYEDPVDCRLSGKATDLAKLMASDATSLHGTGVHLEGSPHLLAELKAILAGLDIDWEMALAEAIGPLPAHFIAAQIRKATGWAHDRRTNARDLSSQYLSEEGAQAVGRDEFELFCEDVHTTGQALDRLEARIDRLRARQSKDPSHP